MNDFKKISPGWAAVAVSVVSFIFVVLVWVRSDDMRMIESNTTRIDALSTQVATLVQSEQDLIATVNRYIERRKTY